MNPVADRILDYLLTLSPQIAEQSQVAILQEAAAEIERLEAALFEAYFQMEDDGK